MSNDFIASVGETVEALMPAKATQSALPTFASGALKQTITAYYFGSTVTDRQKRCVMAALTLCGRFPDSRPTSWQSFVLTWTFCALPETVGLCRADGGVVDYRFEELPGDFISECEAAAMAQGDEATAGEKFVTFPSALPNASTLAITPDLINAARVEGLYAYYAMIVFIMGKSISPENVTAISKRRPDALMRKRSVTDSAYILTGDGKIDPACYRFIQSGWIRSTRPRIIIVTHLAKLNASDSRSEVLDPISVNMDMLKNAGQSYIYYINELLIACPWCIEIPALRSSFAYYARMVHVIASQPTYFQPFFKLAMQDNSKIVRRRDIEALIGVATFFAGQTKKSMNQYRINEGVIPTVIAFRQLAASKGYTFDEVQNQLTTETVAA